ncbi:hypothetical protein POVCU2_0083620 [Plasmodium ovale curtisi]|uniref:Uncharacterized protein n=1 Tax=Plasmodium ovale curtisi TaxID=864141 RepID=A0A1A8WR53_PLAOA|nr:hypothetical protein POVCU1_005740 [Plasmodium ovale curtisi]SBS93793.1 hypothetical protein POVCU2_0083620 [Plasmodium ovale curtisi]
MWGVNNKKVAQKEESKREHNMEAENKHTKFHTHATLVGHEVEGGKGFSRRPVLNKPLHTMRECDEIASSGGCSFIEEHFDKYGNERILVFFFFVQM